MKKIAIWNLEPKYKNLAIEKIRIYYQMMGYEVENYIPLLRNTYEKIFVSSIFTFTKKPTEYLPDNTICGGSGFDLTTNLPEEIDRLLPRINMGFTTRGCNRNCKWCIVPIKEGEIKIEGDLLDLWDGKSEEIKVMDNNILFAPRHFSFICNQAREYKLKIDFNQGLDARLLSVDIVQLLKIIKHKQYRFGFDDIKYYTQTENAIKLLIKNGIKTSTWFVLVGFDKNNTIFPRLELLKKYKQDAFIMIYNNLNRKKYLQLARWVNIHPYFRRYSFKKFLGLRNEIRQL